MPSGHPGTRTHGIAGGKCRCSTCKTASAAYLRAYRKTERGRKYVRKSNLWQSHRITPEQYEALLTAQDGKCAVCRRPEASMNQYKVVALAVDHDHATGKVRGLLCMRCNRALGLLRDDSTIVRALLTYRESY